MNKVKLIDLESFLNVNRAIGRIACSDVKFVRENDKIKDVLEIMFSTKKRRLPVLNWSGDLVGIVSARDVLSYFGGGERYHVFLKFGNHMNAPVGKIMTEHPKRLNRNHPISNVLKHFHKQRRGGYPVLHGRKLFGIVTEWDFVNQINGKIGIKVRDAMRKPFILNKTTPLVDAARILCKAGFRRLPVVERGLIAGIVTPYDILAHLQKTGGFDSLRWNKTPVAEVMEKKVTSVESDRDLSHAIKLMREKKVGGLPVVDDMELLGIVTERDIVDLLEV